MITTRTLPLLVLLTAIPACTPVGPNYARPDSRTPDAFASLDGTAPISPVQADTGDLSSWWSTLNDPTLSSLISRAVSGNRDLRIAEARLREVRALRGIAESNLYPTLDAAAAARRSRSSNNTLGGSAPSRDLSLFEVGLDASWEIDIFGGVRRSIEAAQADLDAASESRRDILVSLSAEVARVYVDVRTAQRRLDLAAQTIRAQEETLALVQARFDAGVGSELEVAQARAQLEARRAQVPPLNTALRASLFRLGVLTGDGPAALLSELTTTADIPTPPSTIPVGLPSELLRRRPDLRQAERELAAATARVGVATADLYPRFTLTGDLGLASAQVGDLLDAGSRTWSIGPGIRWNIFSAGRTRQNILAAGARQEQALLRFESRVLTALEDVELALVQLNQEQQRLASLRAAADASQRAVTLSTDRYSGGIGDFLNVLSSQTQLYDAQDQLVQSQAAVTRAAIALYKALGGGWSSDTPSTPADATPPADTTPGKAPSSPAPTPPAPEAT